MGDIADIKIEDGIASVIIDAPPVNALGHAVRRAIVDNIEALSARSDVTAIVLRCAGRTFFAGADISEFGRPFEAPDPNDVIAALEDCPKPVVAAIHGTALGGGLEVALGAHYRIALGSARLGFPEISLGLLPGAGGTQRAPRAIDAGEALALITSGKPIHASRALELGLIDRLVEQDLDREARAFARELVEKGAPLRRLRDAAVRTGDAAALEAGLQATRTASSAALAGCAEALDLALAVPFAEGLAGERAIFDRLSAGTESQALRHAFFAERAAGKVIGLDPGVTPAQVGRVGVIGAGTMGGGIAMNFLNVGIPVILVEVRQEALDRGVATIQRNYEATAKKGRLTMAAVEERMALIAPTLDFNALVEADLVIEAAFESMEVKKDIFTRLDAIAKPGAILATNTSFLDVDAIAATTTRPQDVLGLHFFSPANVMKLLEVVRGAKTSDAALATAMALAKQLGKSAVVSRVCHGFIANRIMDVRRVAAERILLQGTDIAAIDGALTDYGFPMGQFQMFDLVGLDVMGRDSDARTLMGDFVAAGRLGQKSGGGYYDYDEKRRPARSEAADAIIRGFAAHAGIEAAALDPADILAGLLYPVVNEGARLIEEGIVQRASDIDVAVIAGYGWPAATGGPMFWADTVGLPQIVAALDGVPPAGGDEHFRPCQLLRDCAASGQALHSISS